MFTKVLVANRGEIAVRVQQTLQAMGIVTVAVYSEPDSQSPHVRMADDAYALVGETANDTYLDIEKLLDVARLSGAEAVHPGYGFLSENPEFAQACRDADLVFIGPSPESMELLGYKVRSKDVARRAGVPTVPSSPVLRGNDGEADDFLESVGFPVMVKAAAGGGGRGLRLINNMEDLPGIIEIARRESRSAFGDGRVFLERYVQRPRHIEFQVAADDLGNVIHMPERECSIQRRHQKIIEETPSQAVSPELRKQMGEAAVRLTREAGYVNLGTVEFLLDETNEFYFLEMNARLQVEHPITEAVTGLDLVQMQVQIAAGEALNIRQEDVKASGHAFECRIYSEDPFNEFLPSTGTIRQWVPPSGPGLRLDSGFIQGQVVSPHYDPMLAKLIAWGPDRRVSLSRMEQALRRFIVLGVTTNIPFLRRVLEHPLVREGRYDTALLEEHFEALRPRWTEDTGMVAQALAAWSFSNKAASNLPVRGSNTLRDSAGPWRQAGPWRIS